MSGRSDDIADDEEVAKEAANAKERSDPEKQTGKAARLKALGEEFGTRAAQVAGEIARRLFCTRIVVSEARRGQKPTITVVKELQTNLAAAMRRFGLEPWKSVWTETLQRDLNMSEERGALDRFFGPDLLASTALLSCVYHERPVLGQLLHSRLPQYATARHVFLNNKSLTDVMHAQYFDWFKKGRTPRCKGTLEYWERAWISARV